MKNFGYLALFVFAIHPVFGGEKVPIVSSFEGRIHIGPGFRKKAPDPTERIIKTQAEYDGFVAKIPKRTISKTNPSPPSKDPLLKKPPIDFGKHMMLVAIRSESMYVTSRFESLVSTKNSLIVHVLDPDLGETIFLNQMEGIGTYRAVVVPKHEGTVKFLRKKGKPGPR
jgi:hypothetical protein